MRASGAGGAAGDGGGNHGLHGCHGLADVRRLSDGPDGYYNRFVERRSDLADRQFLSQAALQCHRRDGIECQHLFL